MVLTQNNFETKISSRPIPVRLSCQDIQLTGRKQLAPALLGGVGGPRSRSVWPWILFTLSPPEVSSPDKAGACQGALHPSVVEPSAGARPGSLVP